MKQTRIAQVGKKGKERAKNIKDEAEYLCGRAGGTWDNGHCEGHSCEICDRSGDLQTCHITSRAQGGDESIDNLIVLCQECHDRLDSGAMDERRRMRAVARMITQRKNEREGR